MVSQAEKGAVFRALHERDGAFIIPNPWDVGTALMMQGMGFEALATTSSGFATTLGRFDGQVTREEKLEHCRQISNAVDIPVSADMENCFAHEPEGVAETIRLASETGLVGCSIEDYDNEKEPNVYDFDLAVARVKAGVDAANAMPFPFTITARAEGVLRKKHDLDEAIRRLKAFEEVGAHVLYAPGLTTDEDVRKVIGAVSKPVNVLTLPHFKMNELAAAGAKRISLGGWLARVATGGWLRAAQEMKDTGTFEELNNAASGKDVANVLKGK